MGDATVFWTNVFRVLKHQGRSVEYLARHLGVSHSALFRWRDGSRVAPQAQMQAASNILGVPMALLFALSDLPGGKDQSHESRQEVAS